MNSFNNYIFGIFFIGIFSSIGLTANISEHQKSKSISAGHHYSLFIDQHGKLFYCGRSNACSMECTASPTKINVPDNEKFNLVCAASNFALAVTQKGELYGTKRANISSTHATLIKSTYFADEKIIQLVTSENLDSSSCCAIVALTENGNIFFKGKLLLYVKKYFKKCKEKHIEKLEWEKMQNPSDKKIIYISASPAGFFMINENSEVFSYGNNHHSCLGHSAKKKYLKLPTLIKKLQDKKIQQISGSLWHTLVIDTEGQVWGFGHFFLEKQGTKTDYNSSKPIALLKEFKVSQISQELNEIILVGFDGKKCLIITRETDSEPFVFQENYGPTSSSYQEVCFEEPIVSISSGASHSFIVTKDGATYARGTWAYGVLGLGTKCEHYDPKKLGIEQFTKLPNFTTLHSVSLPDKRYKVMF